MNLLPQEEAFLKVALQLGYLSAAQISHIRKLHDTGNVPLAQILLSHRILDRNQVTEVIEITMADTAKMPQQPVVSPDTQKNEPNQQFNTEVLSEDGSTSEKRNEGELLLTPKISIGQTWQDLEILEELGRGGMGIVYKAKQKGAKRIVALKIMLTATETQRRRFFREAKATAQLSHFNIVAIYQMGEERGYSYFTMQYIDGMTFEKFIARTDVSLEEKLDVLIKVARALHYAHQNKILHRDIKPSNILMDQNREPFLSDFGLAKFLDSTSQLTQTGHALGTPFYMSPEQVMGDKKKIGTRSDVYSLGVILYQVLTNKLPFRADTVNELYRQILSDEPCSPRNYNADIPLGLVAICRKTMEKSPTLRYASAEEFADDLQRFREGKSVKATNFNLHRILHRTYRRIQRYPLIGVAIMIVLVVIVGFILLPTSNSKDWKPYWDNARKLFSEGKLEQSLEEIQRIKNHPKPEQVQKLRQQISEELEKLAEGSFREKEYQNALAYLKLIPMPSRKSLILQAQIFYHSGRLQEMRLALSHLYELNPIAEDLRLMGDIACNCGYFEEAAKYFQAALQQMSNYPETEKKLAEALLYLGKYGQARNYYQKLPKDAEVRLGMSTIYDYEGEFRKALDELDQIPQIADASPFFQAKTVFLKARITWRMHEAEMKRWFWLSRQTGSGQQAPQLYTALQNIEADLRVALGKLSGIRASDYLGTLLSNEIQLYLQAIELEHMDFSAGQAKLEALRIKIQSRSVASHMRIFFTQVMLRFLIRNQKWQEASVLCNSAVETFPWIGDMYHMRSIVRFQLGHLSDALADLERVVLLEKSNFIAVENLSYLIVNRMTQQEFFEFSLSLINRFVFRPPRTNTEFLFTKALQEFRETWMYKQDLAESSKSADVQVESLLNKVLETDSPAVHEMAVSILSAHHDSPKLQQKLDQFQVQYTREPQKSRLQKLTRAMGQRKDIEAMEGLQEILLKYAVFQETHYALEVYRMGKKGEELLKGILHDDQKDTFIRFLAARMMIGIRTYSAYQILNNTVQSNSYPGNILSAIALKEAEFPVRLPQISKEISKRESKLVNPDFCRLLLALHINPKEHLQLAESLLHDRNERVCLAAIYNFRRYLDLPQELSTEILERRFLEFLQSQDSYIRATASRMFWTFNEIGLDVPETDRKAAREKYRQRYLQKYHDVLLSTLRDTSQEVQFAAMSGILIGISGNLAIQPPEFSNTPSSRKITECLWSLHRSSSYFMKFWSAILLSTFDDKEKMWQVINDPNTPYFIKLATLRVMWQLQRLGLTDISSLLVNTLQSKAISEGDITFKQLILFAIGWNFTQEEFKDVNPMLLENFRALLAYNIKDTNLHIRRGAISSLLWAGSSKMIDQLYGYLKSPDIEIARGTACTLAGLTLRHRPHEIPKLQNDLQQTPLQVRKAAAYGYYELIRWDVDVPFRHMSLVDFSKHYDVYLQYLLIKRDTLDNQGLQKWLFALQKAIEIAPSCEYHYEMALVLTRMGQKSGNLPSEIFGHLEKALQLARENEAGNKGIYYPKIHCLRLLGEIYMMLQKYEEARNTFEKLLDEFPFHAASHVYLARIWEDKNNLSKARYHWWHAYINMPSFSTHLLSLAMNYMKEGLKKETIEVLQEYHQKFGLTRQLLHSAIFDPIRNDPWIQSLPK